MGVHGLFSYLQRHPHARERRVYLRDLAYAVKDKTHGKTAKLLCDFFSILYWLLSEFHEAKIKCKDYQPYSYIYGGDVVEYENRFVEFVRALRHLGVEPIFFVDGERGSDLTGFRAKLQTHVKRHRGKMSRVRRCNQVAKYDPKQQVEGYSTWFPQPLVPLSMMMVLQSEGVTLEHCIGEADAYLARRAQSGQEDICGILTNDTDMVVMRSCEVFLCQFFDRELTLGIRSVKFNSKPSEVVCEKLTPCRLAEVLKLPESDLKNLSVICGNDYTEGLNEEWELHKKMNLSYPIIESAAKWLRDTPHMELDETPPFDSINKLSVGQYSEATQFTYKAYGGTAAIEPLDLSCRRSSLYKMVLSGVREGKMTRELLSIVANSIHWRTGVVEIIEECQVGKLPSEAPPCIDDLLLPIRLLIYKLLGRRRVTEHGHTRGYAYRRISVQVQNPSPHLLHDLRKRTELERVCLLTTFLTKAYYLKDVPLDEFEKPIAVRNAQVDCTITTTLFKPLVLCASLLFSYDLRSESNNTFCLEYVPDVFLITCFMCILGKSPRKLLSRPSPEAINIATGFACIIEHSYHLASLLGLFELMPRPAQMYQTAALVPFYHIATCTPSLIKHQLRTNKEMAETHSVYTYVKKLHTFKKLKELLWEVHCTSKSCVGSVSPHITFRLVVAFMEVMADIDEADRQGKLFVQDTPMSTYQGKHSKGKSMLMYYI